MVQQTTKRKPPEHSFGANLAHGRFRELAAEFQGLRDYPPDVTARPGLRAGEILRFVKGLRLSARVIYILRARLSGADLEVSWGHLLNQVKAYCSRECDIIIHEKGFVQKWNGDEHPIMDFRFIEAKKARAVVSCKSVLTSIDAEYAKELRRFGVKSVFLFAECCRQDKFNELNAKARRSGYTALGCLYFTSPDGRTFKMDESLHASFSDAIVKWATK